MATRDKHTPGSKSEPATTKAETKPTAAPTPAPKSNEPKINAKEQATADSLRELSLLMEAAKKEYGTSAFPSEPRPDSRSDARPIFAESAFPPLPVEPARIEFSKVRQYPWHQCTAAFSVLEENFPAEGKEEIRRLRANLWQMQQDEPRPFQFVGITTVDNPGCSWLLAASLAGAHASSAGSRVLLIDADIAQPVLHGKCSIPLSPGLTDLTSGQCGISDVLRRVEGTQLYFITAGVHQQNNLDPLDFRALRAWIPEIRTHFDWVFLRLPTCRSSADVVALEPTADGMLLVIEKGRSGFKEVAECLRLLHPEKLLGTVFA